MHNKIIFVKYLLCCLLQTHWILECNTFFSYAYFRNQYMPQSHYFLFDIRMLESLQKKRYTAK